MLEYLNDIGDNHYARTFSIRAHCRTSTKPLTLTNVYSEQNSS